MSQTETPPVTPRMALASLQERLFIGVKRQGVQLSSFSLRSPTGRLRREMANVETNPYRQVVVALRNVLGVLGGVDSPRDDLLGKLSMPDVDYINFTLTARKHPTGIPVKGTCGIKTPQGWVEGCGAKLTARVDPQAVAIMEATDTVIFEDSPNGRPYQELVFHDPVLEREIRVKIRVPLLEDQVALVEKVREGVNSGMGDAMHLQFSTYMIDWDGRGRGLSMDEMDALPLETLDALFSAAKGRHTEQLDGEVEIRCPMCGRQHLLALPTEEWLTPFVPPTPSGS